MPKKNRKQGFLGQVLTVAGGRGGAQLIAIASTPFIARLFDPEDYGAVALLIALVSPLSVICTLRYEKALILPETDDDAKKLAALALLVVFVSSSIFAIIVGITYALDAVPGWLSPLGGWVLAMPVILFFLGGIKVLEAWMMRAKKFGVLASSDIAQSGLLVSGRLLGGWSMGSSLSILVLTYLASLLVKGGMQYRSVRSYLSFKNLQFSGLKKVAGSYRDFPIYNAPSGFANSFSKSLPMLLFGYFFSPAIVGYYAMASRLFRKPINVVSSSVRGVYMRRAAEEKNRNISLRPLYRKATIGLALLGVLPAFLLMMYGTEICVFILGESWGRAGVFVEILSPMLFTLLLAVPSSAVVVVFRRQALWLRLQLIVALLRLTGCILAVSLWNEAEAVLKVFVIVGIISNIYVVYFADSLIRKDDLERSLR